MLGRGSGVSDEAVWAGAIGFMHQNILALWGMPLGEMWDLEKLAETCRRLGRWTFFVTSAPANVVGELFFSFSSPFCLYPP